MLLDVGDEDQRDRALVLPGDGRDLRPRHEPAVGPDAVLVEAARDARAQRER